MVPPINKLVNFISSMRIVIDTNLIIAGRWNPGSSSNKILDACISGKFQAFYTRRIKSENLFILEKVKPDRAFIDKIIKFYARAVLVREPEERVRVCEDPDDDKYFECALSGNAGIIVSNDHHLLDQSGFRGIQGLRSGEFMRRFG